MKDLYLIQLEIWSWLAEKSEWFSWMTWHIDKEDFKERWRKKWQMWLRRKCDICNWWKSKKEVGHCKSKYNGYSCTWSKWWFCDDCYEKELLKEEDKFIDMMEKKEAQA